MVLVIEALNKEYLFLTAKTISHPKYDHYILINHADIPIILDISFVGFKIAWDYGILIGLCKLAVFRLFHQKF